MATTKPTHEQARLHLQLYEERREQKLREARDWFFKNYIVESAEDAMKIAGPGTQGGTYAMMVWSYWEQACAMLNHGLLHEDLFFETTGEFYGVWEASKSVIPAVREMFQNKLFMGNMEKSALRFESWMESRSPGAIAAMRNMMKQMRAQQKQGKAA